MQIPIIPFRGQRKPWGSIPRINWGHPLTRGLLFYGYDTGAGLIVDLVRGLRPVGGAGSGSGAPPNIVSKFGSGLNYVSGGGYSWFAVDGTINRCFASSLYSIACAWYITALPSLAFTGPFVIADTATNTVASCFWNQTVAGDVQFFLANNSGTPFTANSTNTFHSFVGTNTSATSQSVYFDGKFQLTSAFTATFTTAIMAPAFNTDQISIGSGSNGVNGWVYYGCLWNRTITAQEAALIHNDPYCFLIYPEDEMFATLVGVAAVTTSEDRFHQPWSSVGRRYAIIAAG